MAKFVKVKSELKSEKNKAPFKLIASCFASILLIAIGIYLLVSKYYLYGFIGLCFSAVFIVIAIGYKKRYSILKAGVAGENSTYKLFKKLSNDYTVYTNPTVNYRGKTYEFDFIILSRKGVFTVETKNYSGNINGNYSDEKIEQVKIRGNNTYKKEVKNPVVQAMRQKKIMESFLHKNNVNIETFPIIYFVNERCNINLNNDTDENIFITKNGNDLLEYINNTRSNKKIKASDLEKLNSNLI